jgi:3-oxoacyl-[acyl-carrier-protein] synthase II
VHPHSPRPAVVTGIGVLACNGIGRGAFWDALANGRSGIRFIDRFDTSDMPCHIAGQLWDFNPLDFISKANHKRWHRAVHQSIAAAKLAVSDAEFDPCPYDHDRIAVGIGTSVGNPDETYRHWMQVYQEKGWKHIDKLASTANSGHASTANVSAQFGYRGPAVTLASGCATGLDALHWGREQIRLGLADAAVVGATEAPLEELGFAGTCSLGILSQEDKDPTTAMKPFDRRAAGLVLAEAAVVLILERADLAQARGANILGEVAGCGSAAEGNNPIVLEREGGAVGRAIGAALADAGMSADEVDCAHCHGVSLTNYDRCETHGYKLALGDKAYRIPITATKSMIGQAYSCGGLLSVSAALMTLSEGIVPATLNHAEPDPECDLDYVPGAARMNDAHTALITALSFGGTHAATAVRSWN